jgi:hypothetical protein
MIRWILTAHPLPPLLILPPIALSMTISSALFAYFLLMCCFSGRSSTDNQSTIGKTTSQSALNPSTNKTLMRSIPPPSTYTDVTDRRVPGIAIVDSSVTTSPSSSSAVFDTPIQSHSILDEGIIPSRSEDGTLETTSEARTPTTEEGTWSDVGEGETTEGE